MLQRVLNRRLPVPVTPLSDGPPASPCRALRSSSMRLWVIANTVSNAGAWMQMVAQNLLILQLTGSVALAGLSLSIQALPGLLLGVSGGALVDRWPRRLTAGLGQVAMAAIAFTTAVFAATGMLNVPLLMVLGLMTGLVATVDGPACTLLGNDLVPRRDVPSAIAVGSVAGNVGRLAGTAAGALVASVGVSVAYAANGLSFLLVAVIVPFLKLVHEPDGDNDEAPALGGTRDGLSYIAKNRTLLLLVGIGALTSLLGRNYSLSMADLVTGPLGATGTMYGIVTVTLAVGGIAGSIMAGRMQAPRLCTVVLLFAAASVLQVLTGISPLIVILIAVVIPMAAAEAAAATSAATMLQTVPPRHLRGRVLGAWRTASTGWGLAGPPLLGLILETAGTRTGLVVTGITVAAVLTLGSAAYRRRQRAAEESMASAHAGPTLVLVPTDIEASAADRVPPVREHHADAPEEKWVARERELSAA
ncbi:MAG TPA: MFS transporter [Mycobacterium sp.]|nr:MFS transporter [Mycobacterium sp.]